MRSLAPGQIALFDIRPEGAEIPVEERPITRGCLLPIAQSKLIDRDRAGAILGVSGYAVVHLVQAGLIAGFQLNTHSQWFIEYDTIVAFCDQLRIEYAIADRRRPLAAGRRWRDEELLPFPSTDTVTVETAMLGLDETKRRVRHLCEEGAFECYRLQKGSGFQWRISKRSLFAYAESLKDALGRKQSGLTAASPAAK